MNPSTDPSKTNFFGQVFSVFALGILVATIFTSLTPASVLATSLSDVLKSDQQDVFEPAMPNEFPTPTPRPRPLIGIVAGHWGNDSGAVCQNGLTEAEVNLTIATLVKDQMVAAGFDVDLLKEFDPRLSGYRALALVSIHADSCDYFNDQATGYKVASAIGTADASRSDRLAGCISNRYGTETGLSYHSTSITLDMTSYHAFDEIHHETPAVIIETGFLNLDQQILTRYPEKVAKGITDGIICYIRNEDVDPKSD